MADYYTVLTTVGENKLANASVTGPRVRPATVAVGDGGGPSFYDDYGRTALKARTTLVNERFRTSVNDLRTEADNPNWIVVDGVVPANEGGYNIREVGVIDEDGDLIAIGRFPQTFKPVLASGAFQDMIVRIIMEVSDVESLVLQVDPSAVLATRSFVLEQRRPFVRTPVIESPSDGTGGLTSSVVIDGSAFAPLYSVDTREWRQFQVQAAGGDWTTLLADEQLDQDDYTFTADPDTAYEARIRDRRVGGATTDWSNVVGFTTADTYISTPTNVAPADGAVDIGERPTLEASAFAVVSGTDTHISSRFWAYDIATATLVHDSGVIAATETYQLPANVLEPDATQYGWEAAYEGDALGWSGRSQRTSFTTSENFGGLIGNAGGQGFGVGVYPATLSGGMVEMTGTTDVTHDNYGNYMHQASGSIMGFVPRFYYRIGNPASPNYATYGANAIDIAGADQFADESAANADGYALHRAFIDGGQVKHGFFFDKYICSPNGANDAGISVKNGVPISLATSSGYTNSAGMAGCDGQLSDAVVLSRARGAGFNNATVFMYSAIALLSLAHGQGATSDTHCAWYDGTDTTNYPKGCNSSLADVDDAGVTFTTAGDSDANKPLTGSGTPFAKTTHNGQPNGIADVNGAMYQVALGITSPGSTPTSSSQISNGDTYVLKESVALADLTAGHGGATDAWGTAGSLAVNYDSAPGLLPWGSSTGNVYFGNGTNQVFDEAVSGAGYLRTACGIQQDTSAMSGSGTNLFGQDRCYQYNRENMFVLCAGHWGDGSDAGVFSRVWRGSRAGSYGHGGFRASRFIG